MHYEEVVLALALSYMHDAIAYSEGTMDRIMDTKNLPSMEEVGKRVFTAHNTFKGVFALLSNRYTMIQLRASMESDAAIHSGADAQSKVLDAFRSSGRPTQGAHPTRKGAEQMVGIADANSEGGALSFGWNGSPRIFVKVMKVLVKCLCSPRSAADRREVRGSYKAEAGLVTLGLERHEKKEQWEKIQLVEHLVLEVNLKAGRLAAELAVVPVGRAE
ncbi:hypothetical protein CYMTET_21863 [Cymbomonas tetramitiformis]|uniref:Uncharacterized protein n=1 Tax=Cymbomonas tetramitiformis TaxID=36881 RepID=A0AAE0G1B7_9CHLO|nr:hypothetical protein CYMTET_21863 [Cymbomonas tetramitiformis]